MTILINPNNINKRTWIGVGFWYPSDSQARSKGRDKFRSRKEFAWKDAPSEDAKKVDGSSVSAFWDPCIEMTQESLPNGMEQ